MLPFENAHNHLKLFIIVAEFFFYLKVFVNLTNRIENDISDHIYTKKKKLKKCLQRFEKKNIGTGRL